MKHFIFFIFVLIINTKLISQELLSYHDGRLIFLRPTGVTLWEERPTQFSSVFEQASYWRGKIQLSVNIHNTNTLRAQPPTMFTQLFYDHVHSGRNLTEQDLILFFNSIPEYVAYGIRPRNSIRISYTRIYNDNIVIGESYFNASAMNMQAPSVFSYQINIIIGDSIASILLSYTIQDNFYNNNSLDQYFFRQANQVFWKNDQAINDFYKHFSSDDYILLPEPLLLLRNAYLNIINSLRIMNLGKEINSLSIIKPELLFSQTHISTENIDIKERDDLNSPTILRIPIGTEVQLLRINNYNDNIDGITAPWAIIVTNEGIVGWCFSGYLNAL